MAKKTVRFEDAVKKLSTSLEAGKTYKYADISRMLQDLFSEINRNQIAGLITKMKTEGIFEVHKEKGSTSDYTFIERDNRNASNNPTYQIYLDFIQKLNDQKSTINNPKDFEKLQSAIDKVKEAFKPFED